jgi:hypothetical protein
MSGNIPIVLMHEGDSFYLKYCIESIVKSNPLTQIHLIGENMRERYNYNNLVQHDLNDYKKYAREIEIIEVSKKGV